MACVARFEFLRLSWLGGARLIWESDVGSVDD